MPFPFGGSFLSLDKNLTQSYDTAVELCIIQHLIAFKNYELHRRKVELESKLHNYVVIRPLLSLKVALEKCATDFCVSLAF